MFAYDPERTFNGLRGSYGGCTDCQCFPYPDTCLADGAGLTQLLSTRPHDSSPPLHYANFNCNYKKINSAEGGI